MSVGPIDAIRAQEATQIKHVDTQRAQHAQEQISRNFQNMVQQEHSKPTQMTKTENTEYRYDAKEKGNNQHTGSKSKQKKKDDKDDSKKVANKPKSGGFDVLI